uniref:Glycoprotein M6Ba n=1 Tax=Cyprinus carpio TaxID=7962 RepID=A0A8C2GDZ2_CYPCA
MDGMKPETTAEENQDEREESKGCLECCIKCLGGVPYASLVATILCFSGVALFCGCGHVALTGTVTMVENHFSRITSDHATLTDVMILGHIHTVCTAGFKNYGIILVIMKLEIWILNGFFVFLTYILGLGWLGIFGFSAVPVFLFYNMWTTCGAMKSPIANLTSVDNICVDVRQYGIIPWNATPGKACGSTLSDICNTSEFYLSYHLYIVACAGAGATVIALIHYLMILAANWAYLKGLCQQTHAYQDIKTRDDQELQDVQSRSKEGLNSSYS